MGRILLILALVVFAIAALISLGVVTSAVPLLGLLFVGLCLLAGSLLVA